MLVTKDEDFADRSLRQSNAPVIVWIRLGNATNAHLRAWIVPRVSGVAALVAQGNKLVEVI